MERKNEFEKIKQEYRNVQMDEKEFASYEKAVKSAASKGRGVVVKISMGAAAAVFAVFLILPNISPEIAYAMEKMPILGNLVSVVTFRDYQYDSGRHMADVKVPQIVVDDTEGEKDRGTLEKTKKTAEEINREIEKISEELIQEFKENAKDQEGYQDIMIQSEVINSTEEYFTLKLICYQGAGSGAQWDYFYTMNLDTGERMALSDFFQEGADYKKAISENIKKQMKEQMAADENVAYWVDNKDIPEWNFETITDETGFYINEKGEIVIAFNEGDVAPMYMGCVEFVIETSAVEDILKKYKTGIFSAEMEILVRNFIYQEGLEMRAVVDKDTCISCGLCVSTEPEVFEFDDDGKAVAVSDTTEENKDMVQQCIDSCPVDAISNGE